jgi:hypothetical protein
VIKIHDELWVNPNLVTHLTLPRVGPPTKAAGVVIHFANGDFEFVPAAAIPGLEGRNPDFAGADALRALGERIGFRVGDA